MKLIDDYGSLKQRTKEQITSSDPNYSVWVGANAGTGKTGVLVDRILRLLLSGVAPSRILCLTFTKAAASEMAVRLNDQLALWAVMDNFKLKKSLSAIMAGSQVQESALKLAPLLFSQILDAPGGLKINTIHSFCESLLSRFPVESGIPPHFKVIDERTASELRTEARNRLMLEVSLEGTPVKMAFDHLAALIDENRLSKIINLLDGDRDRLYSMLKFHGSLDSMIANLRVKLGILSVNNTQSPHSSKGYVNLEAIKRAASVLGKGSKTDQEHARRIERWLLDPKNNCREYASVFLKIDGSNKTQGKIITKNLSNKSPDVLETLLSEQSRIFREAEEEKAERIVEATYSLLTITVALIEKYQTLKSKRALLDYDDLIERASQLLEDGRAGWVHYKLDGGIDHILVDESQDTSPRQWKVIASLTDDFFSGEGAGDQIRVLPRTIFVVGDQKQSIFSFQGADPSYFSKMRAFFEKRVKAANKPWKEVDLAVSFRSVNTILKTVDEIFRPCNARDGVINEGQEGTHISSRSGQAGVVELWPTFKFSNAETYDPWDAPLDQLSEESPLVILAKTIALKIKNWLRSKERLKSADRPIQPGDIMILVRTRGQFASEMVRQLKIENIPVAGSDRIVLLQQIAVMDLIAIGQFALLPDDDLNLAIVLKSPFVGFNDDQIFQLSYLRKTTLWECLIEKKDLNLDFTKAEEFLQLILTISETLPPYEFFSNILSVLGGREKLLARLGPEASDPIDEFMNSCLEFEQDHPSSLVQFLNWIRAEDAQIKRDLDQGQNEVRVMTVHGAKGLQSNIVFLPDTCTVPSNTNNTRIYWDNSFLLWPVIKENEESICRDLAERSQLNSLREYRRLLYVAFTRAEDRVYVCGWEGRKGLKEDCWYNLIKSALQRIPDTKEVIFNSEEFALVLEDEQSLSPDQHNIKLKTIILSEKVPDWAHKRPTNKTLKRQIIRPSQLANIPVVVNSPLTVCTADNFKWGNLIHKLLEILPKVDPPKQKDAALRFLENSRERLGSSEKHAIISEVLNVVQNEKFSRFFGLGSLGEVPLIGVVKNRKEIKQVLGTLDRILVSGKKVELIDFKTDRLLPSRLEDVPERYLKQIATYKVILEQIYGSGQVETFLLWTKSPELMYLDREFIDSVELD